MLFRSANSLDEYLKLFQEATDNHVAIGEASTTYLRSFTAVPNILEAFPQSVFIVCLRNPIEMLASVHAQLFRGGVETEQSIEKAWQLQVLRSRGQQIPAFCPEPKELQYGKACLLGQQVKRLLDKVPRVRILFVFLEDLRSNPRQEYLKILSFLNTVDDGRQDFCAMNQRSEPKFQFITRILGTLNHMKNSLGIKKAFGLGAVIGKVNTQRITKPEKYNQEFLADLQEYFNDDIKTLSNLTNRDLSEWLLI